MEVVKGVHRFGSRFVNWYLVEHDGAFTVVDAGMPAHWPQLTRALEERGATPRHVEAVVLTHTHLDHVGFWRRLHETTLAKSYAHEADAEPGWRRVPPMKLHLRPSSWPWAAHALRTGMLRLPNVGPSLPMGDGQQLDVPGSPTVVHTPGHTRGSCSFFLPAHGVLLTGDALVTFDPYTGRHGPRLMIDDVNESTETALASLARMEATEASVVLPGHGEPTTQGARSAVADARARA